MYLRPGQLSAITGVSTDTLRHYEKKGLLPMVARSANGYREYPPDAPARVRLVRACLRLGFTLEEMAEILAVRDRGDAPCRMVRDLAVDKLARVEEQIEQLRIMREELTAVLRNWEARLHDDSQPARLLETLPQPEKTRRKVVFRILSTSD